MSFLNKVVDKITSGPQAQYILGGALVVIIALSLTSVVISTFYKNKPTVPSEWHAFCLKTEKEFVIKPDEMQPGGENGPDGIGRPDGLYKSPFTNEYTAVMMTKCPNCEKWFVPEYMKKALARAESGSPMMMPPDTEGDTICPYCETNIVQWYREHRKHR